MWNVLFRITALVGALWALGCASTPLTAQVMTPQEEIRDLVKQMEEGWNSGSLDEFLSVFDKTESIDFVTPHGYYRNYTELYNGFRRTFRYKKQMGKLRFNILRTIQLAPYTWFVSINWRIEVLDAMGPRSNAGILTLVVRRGKGGWRIISGMRI